MTARVWIVGTRTECAGVLGVLHDGAAAANVDIHEMPDGRVRLALEVTPDPCAEDDERPAVLR